MSAAAAAKSLVKINKSKKDLGTTISFSFFLLEAKLCLQFSGKSDVDSMNENSIGRNCVLNGIQGALVTWSACLHFYSDDLSSNTAEAYRFSVKFVF